MENLIYWWYDILLKTDRYWRSSWGSNLSLRSIFWPTCWCLFCTNRIGSYWRGWRCSGCVWGYVVAMSSVAFGLFWGDGGFELFAVFVGVLNDEFPGVMAGVHVLSQYTSSLGNHYLIYRQMYKPPWKSISDARLTQRLRDTLLFGNNCLNLFFLDSWGIGLKCGGVFIGTGHFEGFYQAVDLFLVLDNLILQLVLVIG